MLDEVRRSDNIHKYGLAHTALFVLRHPTLGAEGASVRVSATKLLSILLACLLRDESRSRERQAVLTLREVGDGCKCMSQHCLCV